MKAFIPKNVSTKSLLKTSGCQSRVANIMTLPAWNCFQLPNNKVEVGRNLVRLSGNGWFLSTIFIYFSNFCVLRCLVGHHVEINLPNNSSGGTEWKNKRKAPLYVLRCLVGHCVIWHPTLKAGKQQSSGGERFANFAKSHLRRTRSSQWWPCRKSKQSLTFSFCCWKTQDEFGPHIQRSFHKSHTFWGKLLAIVCF